MNTIPTEIQSAIDIMAKHLAAQRGQSADPIEGCAYRGPDGAKCAIGCLFSEGAYEEAYGPERMSVDTLLSTAPKIAEELYRFKPEGMELGGFENKLMVFQEYHDKEKWRGEKRHFRPTYLNRLEEFTDKPDADLEAAINADLVAAYWREIND